MGGADQHGDCRLALQMIQIVDRGDEPGAAGTTRNQRIGGPQHIHIIRANVRTEAVVDPFANGESTERGC